MEKILLSIIAAVFCTVGANAQNADSMELETKLVSGELKSEASILPQPDPSLSFEDYKQAALQYVGNYISLVGVYYNSILNKAIEYHEFSNSVIENTIYIMNIEASRIGNETDESRKILIGDRMSNVERHFVLATEKLIACSGIEAFFQDAIEEGMDADSLKNSCREELSQFMYCTTDVSVCEQAVLNKLNAVISPFKAQKAKAELLGNMGTEKPGPAVEVTDGETTVTLYNPQTVKYKKVE